MVNQLIQMAAWKGMQQKNFPLWTLLNAYNQQPDRLMEMNQIGFFPSEQGPIRIAPPTQQTVVAEPVQSNPVEPVQSHDAKLADEVRSIKEDVKQLLKCNSQQHRRIQDLENHVKQTPATPTP